MKHYYSSIFSYYGGKSKLAPKYPKPIGDVVVEPFCGGASYSLLYYRREIFINDKDPVTASVWRFLLQPDALDWIERFVPKVVEVQTPVSEIFDEQLHPGLFSLMRCLAAQGVMGTRDVRLRVSPWGARDWSKAVAQLQYWIPKISHWKFSSGDYTEVENREATWFVDPPYANAAGSIYRTNDVDYGVLADWCRSRKGQVIVCENDGATWLPFKSFFDRMGSFTGRDSVTRASGGEVLWVQGDEGLFTFKDW